MICETGLHGSGAGGSLVRTNATSIPDTPPSLPLYTCNVDQHAGERGCQVFGPPSNSCIQAMLNVM
jgi:hypothetical protein